MTVLHLGEKFARIDPTVSQQLGTMSLLRKGLQNNQQYRMVDVGGRRFSGPATTLRGAEGRQELEEGGFSSGVLTLYRGTWLVNSPG